MINALGSKGMGVMDNYETRKAYIEECHKLADEQRKRSDARKRKYEDDWRALSLAADLFVLQFNAPWMLLIDEIRLDGQQTECKE